MKLARGRTKPAVPVWPGDPMRSESPLFSVLQGHCHVFDTRQVVIAASR
jgi:hypothetical protein